MSGALAANGGQPDKPTKFVPIYTGRFFGGLCTNRSPLRDANTDRITEKFYGPAGDALIAGANLEMSNKLTMIRRPGNPIYDNAHTYDNINSFDEFRISKGLADAWGGVTESIDTMIDTASDLFALNSAFVRQSIFSKGVGTGQSYMKQVGNQLYWGDGANDKKWNQSLFVRDTTNNLTLLNTDSYNFMDTFLIDPNGNMQQLIGVKVANITNVAIAGNVLTITVGSTLGDAGVIQPAGTHFMFWNLATNTWLDGATITLTQDYTQGVSTTLVGTWTGSHADTSSADTGYVQADPDFVQATSSPVAGVAKTGASVPTWGTTVPNTGDDFYGSTTLDGNILWQNRGTPTQNWGLAAPTIKPTFSASGSATGWAKHTYYSPSSIYAGDGTLGGTTHGFLWQITTAGITGATEPTWPASPTVQTKIDIKSVSITTNVVTFTTETQALTAGDTVAISLLDVAQFLNGQTLTVLSSGLTTTVFKANFTHPDYTTAADRGIAIPKTGSLAATTQADGAATWTAIQNNASLTWQAHHHYHEGDFLLNSAGSGKQYFFLRKNSQPFINSAIAMIGWNTDPNVQKGDFDKSFPAPAHDFANAPTSLNWQRSGNANFLYETVNGAGEVTGGTTDSNHAANTAWAATCMIYIPAPGQYTFSCSHGDGAYFAFAPTSDGGTGTAFRVLGSGTNIFANTPPKTAVQGYLSPSGNNNSAGNTSMPPEVPFVDSATWSFSQAGNYGFEVDFARWRHSGGQMIMKCANQQLAITPDESGTNQPAWPAFTTTGASWDSVNLQINFPAKVTEAAGQYQWNNVGGIGDFTWIANTDYTLPGTQIVDTNSNEEGAIRTGATGTVQPVWNTALNSITPDPNPNLVWLNEGPVPNQSSASGKITAVTAQGWIYALALVNTIDNTVSNIGPLTVGTGPIIGGQVTFAPGAGLNSVVIDPQADYVAIFRTTDGLATELLIPGFGNTLYTVPLVQYLRSGYVDTTPDTGLDSLAPAAQSGENTPPLPGAINLTYHLNRLWYSIGNTVFYTTGPLAPIGNGINGTAPLNFDKMPSNVKRLVPTSIGVLVFTVSDIWIIETNGGNIYPGIPYAPDVGLSSYNALDTNGPQIGFFSTDHQFLVFDPSGGLGSASVPIADQLQLQNGQPGSDWNPATAYVAHYANGQDMAWFLADGTHGWYRLITTPAPEQPKPSWSPFATIGAGVKAIKSVETAPGIHRLLQAASGTGVRICQRDINATTDNGSTGSNGTQYPAYGVLGSYVVGQPGQVAQIAFVTTDSVNTGSPLIIGLLLDEALPYFTGSFEMLKNWKTDPPGLPESKSILGQRFYLSELPDSSAACRHMQVMIQWPAEAAQNELLSMTIFGNIVQEQ